MFSLSQKDLVCIPVTTDEFKRYHEIINDIHDNISTFEYNLLEYTTPVFSRDVAKIVDEYTITKTDWSLYDKEMKRITTTLYTFMYFNFIPSLESLYSNSKIRLKSLVREKHAGFSYQVENMNISWYENKKINIKHYNKVNLSEIDLPCGSVSVVSFTDLYISNGKVDDLWRFILRNSHALKTTSNMYFLTQRLHECELADFINQKLNDNNLMYEMSNYEYASFEFVSYSLRSGDTRTGLNKFLCDEEKNTLKKK